MSTPEQTAADERIVERFQLKAFVEACLVLEEGVAGVRDIDMGLMLGAGMVPGPFARADLRGLDEVLAALERAEQEWGEHFEPPVILRRLVAQGRLGAKSGQGFYPYPQPEPGYETAPVKLDFRGDTAVAWLDNPPANSLAPHVIEGLRKVWDEIQDRARALVIASPNPALFCAGADIKAFTRMDAAAGKELLDGVHGLLRRWEGSRVATIAAVNGLAFGGGCELTMACDVRVAGFSATFGQPEVNLGIIPGFGGTVRLTRLVGPARALEIMLMGTDISAQEALRMGLVNKVVPEGTVVREARNMARVLATKPTGSVQAILSMVQESYGKPQTEALALERDRFSKLVGTPDMREGLSAFIEKRKPAFQ
jgi:enoyl-CoA hydratase / 3-hydroxyacyl-CoA dehydrogenase